jgi:tetratricopeptide (TPR) repeat protein
MDFRILGSTERFEKLCKLLLLKEYPSLQTIDGRAGDQGKDSFIGTFEKAVHIFQVKYFDRIGPNQKTQIEDSLETASKSNPDKWTLLVSTEFGKHVWTWFGGLRKKYPLIVLDVWQAPRIESLVLDVKNQGLMEDFPELFPITSIVDRSVRRTLESTGILTQEAASSLMGQIDNKAISKEELVKLVGISRNKQYSAEIIAANKMVEQFDDEQKAVQTYSEVYEKASAEGDLQNELSAIYGLVSTQGKVPEPDPQLFRFVERGIELATTLGTRDALAQIEAQKVVMLQSVILLRYRHLHVTSLIMTTTGTLAVVLPFLREEEIAIGKLGEELRDTAIQAGTHAFESGNLRVLGTVMMQIGFSIGLAAFQYKALQIDTKVYSEAAESLLEKAREIFAELGDENLLAYAENNLAVYWWSMRDKEKAQGHAEVAVELARKTKNKFIETRMSETLDELEKGALPPADVKKVDYTPEVQEQLLRFTTKEMGFDIKHPKTREDVVVATGMKDLNPERILRYCQYMKVDQVSTSFLGRMSGIPTIGQKRIGCIKFGYGLESFDLDHLSELFKQQHCDACRSRKPRDAPWKWTFEWEKNKAHEYESLAKN